MVSTARAQTIYQDVVTAAGPAGYWRLNELAGPTAVNSGTLGAAANGTFTGTPSFGVPGPVPAGGFSGFAPANTGAGFPAGSYVSLPTGFLPTNNHPRTYEMWFNADGGSATAQAAFSYGGGGAGQRINITADNGTVAVAVNGHNYGKTGLALSGWNHLVITLPSSPLANLPVTSNEFLFYLNGQALAGLTNIAGSSQTVNTLNSPGSVGRDGVVSGTSYLRSLDEVAAYNGALPASEIAHHYAAAQGQEATTVITLSDFATAAKNGESPATSGVFAGPLYVRERAINDNTALEVEAFIKFDLSGISGEITSATLVLPETNKLNNVNSADIFLAQVLEDWNSVGLDPVFGNGLTDGTDVTGEIFIGNNGAATAGPAVAIDHYVDLTSLVQMWIDDPSSNFGLRLRLNNQNAGAAFDANSVRLLVGQVVPEPASYVVWLIAGVGMYSGIARAFRRRRRCRRSSSFPVAAAQEMLRHAVQK